MKYDAANRLIKYNGKTVTYDADGNMTYGPLNGELASFTYDCRNRLVSAGDTGYEYDAENNRIGVKTGTSETSYVVENNSGSLSQILSATERSLSEEKPADTTLYIYGNGLLAQEDETGEYLLYHFNNIGSTSAVTDMDGTIVHAYSYGTYGELLSGNREGIRFLYNGRYGVVTDENGLYYMRARYYNVDIKRFINQDVVEGSIATSPSLNQYAYCQGNPVKLTDPFGLSPFTSWSVLGHGLLDVLGFIPVIGAIPDTVNALWYLAEGDHFSAAASFVSAVPGWGDVIGAVGKTAKGCSKVSKMVRYGSKIVGRIGNIALGSYQTGSIAVSLYDKHMVQGESWDWDSTVQLFSAGLFATTTVVSAKGLANDLSNYSSVKYDIQTSQCFVEGTLVLTKEGNKPIEEIQAGDLVYATDPETGGSGYKEVLRTFRKESDVLIHVFVNGEEIETTAVHPFWVENRWVSAKDLKEGDLLTLADGSAARISGVYGEKLDEAVVVYNFEVEEFHTYYVTEAGVLVHNANKVGGCGVTGNKSGSKTKQIIKNRYPNEPQTGKRFNYVIENRKIHIANGIQNTDFVIDMDGNLYLGRGHSFLANGMNVQAAGTLKVNSQGYVRSISNGSGHYTPTVEQGRMFPSLLNDLGIRTQNAWLELGDYSFTSSGYVDLTKSGTIIQQLK